MGSNGHAMLELIQCEQYRKQSLCSSMHELQHRLLKQRYLLCKRNLRMRYRHSKIQIKTYMYVYSAQYILSV